MSNGGQGARASVEHGLPGDTAAARPEFERRMQARRLAPGGEAGRKALRRVEEFFSLDKRKRVMLMRDGPFTLSELSNPQGLT